MNVAGEVKQVSVVVDQDRFVAALEERALTIVAVVEVHGVAGEEGAHEIGDGVFFLLVDEKVEVIGHEAVGDKLQVALEVLRLTGDAFKGLSFEGEVFGKGIAIGRGQKGGLEVGKEDRGVLEVAKNEIGADATIVDVVEAIFDVSFEGVFAGHE